MLGVVAIGFLRKRFEFVKGVHPEQLFGFGLGFFRLLPRNASGGTKPNFGVPRLVAQSDRILKTFGNLCICCHTSSLSNALPKGKSTHQGVERRTQSTRLPGNGKG